jgi:tetratricopeptide (TPR) repeat protein
MEGMGARHLLERGAAIARKLGDLRLESGCLGWLAIQAFWSDDPVDEGLAICAEMLDRPGISPVSCPNLLVIAGILKRMAGLEAEGAADFAVGTALMRELGRTLDAHAFAMGDASVSLLAGRFVEAEERQVPALEALRAYGEAGYLSTATAIAALALCGQGRYAEAESLAQESKQLGAEDDLSTQIYWRAAYAQILAARGKFEEASTLAEEALDLARPKRSLDFELAAFSAAEVFREEGRTDEARRMLAECLDISRHKGNAIGAAWVEQRLGELDAAQSP